MKKAEIISAFDSLNDELSEIGVRGEVGVVGGAAMVLAFNARAATKDVGAVFVPSADLRKASKRVAEKLGLHDDWINDAVKGYLPKNPEAKSVVFSGSHLTVWVPEAEYLLAMKAIAARFDTQDASDLKFLVKHLGMKSKEAVFAVVEKYYPKKAIPPKTQFFVEELFDSSMSESLNAYGIPRNEDMDSTTTGGPAMLHLGIFKHEVLEVREGRCLMSDEYPITEH